ncbi:Site-specific recombinase XerD [Bacteroides faecichinchillae]|uniref:Site-specific recombinase XerD n=1 Tax=Bacteroides faecichinchillae TaxID=871325 RepID=A0A1M4W9Z6_9BACE|nr:site-specific integrase [Bacteroides faecichinchillae]SHE77995.1 Site-specific recombinase XerD [Bacteroides faecichinchillae]
MSKSNLNIRFYLRTNHVNRDGTCAIMVRISVNGERTAFSTKLSADPNKWDADTNHVDGKSKADKELNRTLDDMRASIRNHYYELERYDALVTAEKVRNAFLGITVRTESLMQLFKEYVDECRSLLGISRTKATVQKYDRCYRRVQEFLKAKYKLSDIPLVEIGHKFITDLECYLRTVSKCNENTTAKFLQTFKMIIIRARNNGYIKGDPFANYKIRLKRVDRGYLTEEELKILRETPITSKRVAQVRDVFLFACYTGLAYIDLKLLRAENIRTSFDGNQWIMTHRHKTDTPVNVPILDIPMELIERYKGVSKKGYILPILSNQKMNQYLKDVAEACGIEKNITFHMARHTNATLLIYNGTNITTVQKLLGHKSVKTTQIYTNIMDITIVRDLERTTLLGGE